MHSDESKDVNQRSPDLNMKSGDHNPSYVADPESEMHDGERKQSNENGDVSPGVDMNSSVVDMKSTKSGDYDSSDVNQDLRSDDQGSPDIDDPEVLDLTDVSDSEDDSDYIDHFENYKNTYGGARPNSSSNVDELEKNAAKLSDTTFDGFRHHCPVPHDFPTSGAHTFDGFQHHWPVPHEVPTSTAAKETSTTTTAAKETSTTNTAPKKNKVKSEENTEEINILIIQTKESTPKSATITPKIVGHKLKPAKQASKAKVERLGWDTQLPAELAKEFQEWLNELKVISEYSFERYVFGSESGRHSSPPDKNSLELHVFVDGGGSDYGATVFLRFKDKNGFKMMRIFACSRVIGPNSSLSVPRRELCRILLGIRKATAMAIDLEIPKDNIFLPY